MEDSWLRRAEGRMVLVGGLLIGGSIDCPVGSIFGLARVAMVNATSAGGGFIGGAAPASGRRRGSGCALSIGGTMGGGLDFVSVMACNPCMMGCIVGLEMAGTDFIGGCNAGCRICKIGCVTADEGGSFVGGI